MSIKEKRLFKISGRIIKFTDLKVLADFLVGEKLKAVDGNRVELESSATCADTVVYSSQNMSLFEDGSPIKLKRVTSLRMSFYNYDQKSQIEISLIHGDSWRGSEVTISGIDSDWVNGCLTRLQEIFESFQPQNIFVSKFKNYIRLVIALGSGALFFWVYRQIVPPNPSPEPPPHLIEMLLATTSGKYAFKYFAYACMGFFPGMFFYEKLAKCWPPVELQVGPEHSQIEAQRRKWISAVLLIGVVPFCINIISDVVKAFW